MSKRRTWVLLFIFVYAILLSIFWNFLKSVLFLYKSTISANSSNPTISISSSGVSCFICICVIRGNFWVLCGSFSGSFTSYFVKLFQSLTQLISISSRRCTASSSLVDDDYEQNFVTHHSHTQLWKNFDEIKLLRIELPSGKLGIDESALLKWRADFGFYS
uniref:F-box family protein n=1 Tax=Solanum tuberosum TaxID=4113 RepID=M1BX09_SOLTU